MKPILFNTPMALAIDNGSKTASRRIVSNIPPTATVNCFNGKWFWSFFEDGDYHIIKLPYSVGDILYVREAFQKVSVENHNGDTTQLKYKIRRLDYTKSFKMNHWNKLPKTRINDSDTDFYIYRASKLEITRGYEGPDWIPSIHMPRDAARNFLRVTSVKIERLQDITLEEIRSEGAPRYCNRTPCIQPCSEDIYCPECKHCPYASMNAYTWFNHMWDSIIPGSKFDTLCWNVNPWVAVIKFVPVSREYALKNG